MIKSLYIKYRPQKFSEVTGQEVIKRILMNSIINNKINHAYLLYGIRGTGKTTLARIFAKAVNCPNIKDGEPCNECSSCVSISNSSSFDTIEIDAASNNGVDEIRKITSNTNLLPTINNYKIYIIDEVHMLSKAAFNALLKTLEEPPQNVIFILATTEMNRIPITILSRTINLNLEVLTEKEISDTIISILDKEKVSYESKAIDLISFFSEGSLRDAISLLESTLLYDEKVTEENTVRILGIINPSTIRDLLINDHIKLVDTIKESHINGSKLLISLLEELTNLISLGNSNFNSILTDLIRISPHFNDPMVVKLQIISIFSKDLNNVPRETLSSQEEQISNKDNIEDSSPPTSEKEYPEGDEDHSFTHQFEELDTKTEQNPEDNIIPKEESNTEESQWETSEAESDQIEKTIEEKIVLGNDNDETKEESKEEPKEVSEDVEEADDSPEGLKIITDYLSTSDYLRQMQLNDKELRDNHISRWEYIPQYSSKVNWREYVKMFKDTNILTATEEAIIVGFGNQESYDAYKRNSLTPEMEEFLFELLGSKILLLPVKEKTWMKLLGYYRNANSQGYKFKEKLKMPDHNDNKDTKFKEKMKELFGDNIEIDYGD